MPTEHVDVLIVGAGLSGVGAAYYIQTRTPGKSYAVIEAREAMGGTWDLFRYPGVRSDSDMYTLGYTFRPWMEGKVIADGPSILNYIHDTAAEYGIDKKIRYQHKLVRAEWSSAQGLWTVDIEREDDVIQMTCQFIYMCTGYYDYDNGYTPEWQDIKNFKGQVIHPQKWSTDLDYTGKRVVVIGSGATAVTIVPAMTDKAAHVTMLQRSPTYVLSLPSQDPIANWMQGKVPARISYGIARWIAILRSMLLFTMSRRRPEGVKNWITGLIQKELGTEYDVKTHFTPTYNPWDQRLCLVPDSDLFKAIKAGKASMVTDHIESFTEKGICLRSGQELEADIIVTATGLVVRIMKGVELVVDGSTVDLSKTLSYKGMMYSDIPNLASAFGYTNASWTLKCELTSQYICRLLDYMDKHGYSQCTPRRNDPTIREIPVLDFNSSYIQRVIDTLPRQGDKVPWRVYQNYIFDLFAFKYSSLEDGTMEFSRATAHERARA